MSPELGDQVRAALRGPSATLKANGPAPQYDQAVRDAIAALDRVAARFVPAEERARPSFRARVLADLLEGTATEYDEAYKTGTARAPRHPARDTATIAGIADVFDPETRSRALE